MFKARALLATAFAVVLTMSALTAPSALAKGKPGGGGSGTTATSYSGSAVVVDATVDVLSALGTPLIHVPVHLSDAALPSPAGGMDHEKLIGIAIDGPPLWLDANVASAATAAAGDRSHSSASVADVALGLGVTSPTTLALGASVLRSSATAKCGANGPELSGGANIVGLTIVVNGTPYGFDAAAPPNTKVEVPGVIRIIINEQIKTANSITVNALHIQTLSPLDALLDADIVISQAHADINCEGGENPPPPPPCQVLDFFTGGGQIINESASFGSVGGQKPNGLSGHFNLVDRNEDIHLQGNDVTLYEVINTTTRRITYDNGAIVVTIVDAGEPGSNDTIKVQTAGKTWEAKIQGNIQIHKPVGCGSSGGKGGGKPR